MGLLDKLWDETVAGPTPDSGLEKLRKYNSFSSSATAPPPLLVSPPLHDNVSRCINNLSDSPSALPSPSASSTTPTSPFSPKTTPGPGGNVKKLTRRKSASAAVQPKGPTGYDWIVLSALDR